MLRSSGSLVIGCLVLLLAPGLPIGAGLPAAEDLAGLDVVSSTLGTLPAPDLPPVASSALPGDDAMRSPYQRFLRELSERPLASTKDLGDRVDLLFHETGYHTALDAINETNTVSFPYPVGDVNGDGKDDVAFEFICADWDTCDELVPIDLRYWRGICPVPHWLEVRSGVDGSPLWTWRLDTPATPLTEARLEFCVKEFVMGTIRQPDGTYRMLVYRWVAHAFGWVLLHDVYLLDFKTKQVVWHYEDQGVFLGEVGRNVFIWPILQSPQGGVTQVLPAKTQTTLFLRGMGFTGFYLAPYVTNPPPVAVIEYRPIEWAARFNPETGEELWRVDTFLPDPQRSVIPESYQMVRWMTMGYCVGGCYWASWGGGSLSCCWDLSGDGLPDLIFTTSEWDVGTNHQQWWPKIKASRIIAFDAVDGHELYSLFTETNNAYEFYYEQLSPMGDLSGDGIADYEDRIMAGNREAFRFDQFFRSGKDGAVLWKPELPSPYLVLPDVSGDKGNEVYMGRAFGVKKTPEGGFNVTDYVMGLFNGRDGKLLWELPPELMLPMEMHDLFRNQQSNGLPDFDEDGIGDVWGTNYTQVDDLTMKHNLTALSGRTGTPLFNVPAAGAFAYPIGGGDLDGDGGDDAVILQGDIVDLWATAHNGKDGHPLWTRRVLAIPASSEAHTSLILEFYSLNFDGQAPSDLLLSFNAETFSVGGGVFTSSRYQQHVALEGSKGTALWGVPELEEGDVSLKQGRYSPATEDYFGLAPKETVAPAKSSIAGKVMLLSGSSVASVGLSFLGFHAWNRRRKKL